MTAKIFVGSLQPRRDVDRIAIGRVVEESSTAEIAHNRRPGMSTNPRDAERNSFFATTLLE